MSLKRRNTSSPECEASPKRRQTDINLDSLPYDDSEDEYDERPQIDASTGQAGAFPGLSTADNELFYGPANDGIDYLRMVRSEASGIPQSLSAPRAEKSADTRTDAFDGGYWDEEGTTYTAGPDTTAEVDTISMSKAQSEYYRSLLAQFTLVRATMRCIPPLSAIEKLTSSQPISFPDSNKNARVSWTRCLKMDQPVPAQIACMDESSIFELVKLISKRMVGFFESADTNFVRLVGAWIWAVLGKCPESGLLGADEISLLRQFAQKAILIGQRLQDRDRSRKSKQSEIIEEDGSDESSDAEGTSTVSLADPERLEQLTANANGDIDATSNAETRGLTAHNAGAILGEKMVILDMIVTVIGEVYGQRDLLDSRQLWKL